MRWRGEMFVGLAAFAMAAAASGAERPIVFISSFAAGEKGAIQAFEFDSAKGELKLLHRTAGAENPFFLAVDPEARTLYAIYAKSFGGKENEQIAAYGIEGRSGKLTFLNRQSSRGTASCYLDVDRSRSCVVVANYSSGSVAALPVQKDGSLGEPVSFIQHTGSSVSSTRQKEPHAHCLEISPNGRFAYAADLGLDKILCYKLDAGTAKLTPNDPAFVRTPPGAGPRHVAFHPSGKGLYAINELSNSITHFSYDGESGRLTERETISTLPAEFKGESYCADLKFTPDGKFLYGTNRGHDSIAAYRVAEDGGLSLIAIEPSLGKGPQNLLVLPGGKWLLCANMPGNSVATFEIDGGTGRLKSAGKPIDVVSPSCIRLLPAQ